MTYSGPKRQNRCALWVNERKTAANQPDYKGNLEISWELLQEIVQAFNSGSYSNEQNGPCVKLDLALYLQQPGASPSGRSRPVLAGNLSTVAETAKGAMLRKQAAQGYSQQQQQPAPQPAPQQVPQQVPQPAPLVQGPQPVPASPPAPISGAIHAPSPGLAKLPQNF